MEENNIDKERMIECGRRIVECRKLKGYNQTEFAQIIDRKRQYLCSIEKGKKPLARVLAKIMAEELDVNYEYLLCYTDYSSFDQYRKEQLKNMEIRRKALTMFLEANKYVINYSIYNYDETRTYLTYKNEKEIMLRENKGAFGTIHEITLPNGEKRLIDAHDLMLIEKQFFASIELAAFPIDYITE